MIRREKRKRSPLTRELGDRAPTAMAISGNVIDKLLIFLRRPQASLHFLFVTARMVPHILSLSLEAYATATAAAYGSISLSKGLFLEREKVEKKKRERREW